MENKTTVAKPQTLWNRSYIFVLLINTLNAFSFYMVATILSKYLVGIGTTISFAGFIVGLFSITSLFCRPFCGLMSDRLNNVKLLKWSNVLMGLGLLGFAFTQYVPLIIFFRILNGIGFAIGGTAQVALATKFIPENKMGEGIGYMGLGMVVGSAAAPGIGLIIADAISMKMTFIAAAALTVVAYGLLMTVQQADEPKVQGGRYRIALRDIFEPRALPFTLVAATFSFVNGIIASYLVLFADDLGIVGISIYFTLYAVFLFIVRPFSGKLMDAKGMKVTVFPGLILTAVSMFLLGRAVTLPLVLLTAVLRAIGQGAAQPSLQAGCINYVGRERSGVATSTYYLGGDIGQGVGPMLGGMILMQITGLQGYRTLFDLCGMLLLTAMVYFYFVARKEKL